MCGRCGARLSGQVDAGTPFRWLGRCAGTPSLFLSLPSLPLPLSLPASAKFIVLLNFLVGTDTVEEAREDVPCGTQIEIAREDRGRGAPSWSFEGMLSERVVGHHGERHCRRCKARDSV